MPISGRRRVFALLHICVCPAQSWGAHDYCSGPRLTLSRKSQAAYLAPHHIILALPVPLECCERVAYTIDSPTGFQDGYRTSSVIVSDKPTAVPGVNPNTVRGTVRHFTALGYLLSREVSCTRSLGSRLRRQAAPRDCAYQSMCRLSCAGFPLMPMWPDSFFCHSAETAMADS